MSDFEAFNWHDNPIHGFGLVEGEYGLGKLVLDIDYITEWVCSDEGSFSFRIAPADLVFEDVSDLVVSLDYQSCSAGLTPPSIHVIRREPRTHPNGHQNFAWHIDINWPSGGYIRFTAPGFTQTLRKEPILSDGQVLDPRDRD